MKIVSFVAENFKRLKAVEIRPDGSMVIISGPNEAGKSSIMDGIFAALGGAKASPKRPIRKGQETARLKVDLGEIIVTRKFDALGSKLVVEAANGARFTKPQQMLDELIGAISFDPLKFTSMEPEEQYETLRKLVKLEVDIDALAGMNQRDYDTRTDLNRRAKQLRAQADGITIATGLPDQPIDISALSVKIQEAGEHNALIERRKANRAQVERDVQTHRDLADGYRKNAADLRLQAEKADETAANHDGRAAEFQAKLDGADALPEPIETAPILANINAAQATNQQIAARDNRRKIETEAETAEKSATELTEIMAARDEQKTKAIAGAKMPIDGLTFGDGEVLYDGLPFEQASSAMQIRVSMAIAMALNPKLRVLTVKQGSLVDENGLKIIKEMVEAADYQLWLEKVDTSGKIGIVIEDGSVKQHADEPADDQPQMPLEAAS